MLPKTKIVATIGPSSDSLEMIENLIRAGVSVFRFNMKHGDHEWHSERMKRVRKVSLKVGRPVAILMDLQGPEVRIGSFKEGKIEVKKGELVYFATEELKDKKTIILEESILKKIGLNQKILLADGFFEFNAVKKGENYILAEVIEGGILGSRKNVTLPGLYIDLPTLVKRDLENISIAIEEEIDFFALSFVRNRADVETLRKVLRERKLPGQIIAKIEQQEALKNFEEILESSDGIMVARGDLGVQIPMERVPYYQKLMIQRCRDVAKPVITATQMLESMVSSPRPTRAEVNDVANAVYDQTDAIMLSGESASGQFPVKAVETMFKIASFTEEKVSVKQEDIQVSDQTSAIVANAYKMIDRYFAEDPHFKGICIFTQTGKTARFMSKLRPSLPIFAFTQSKVIRDQLCLSWGIQPFILKRDKENKGAPKRESIEFLRKNGLVKKGDKIVMIYGSHWGEAGETNTIRIESL